MKKSNLYLFLAIGALGIVALSTKIIAGDAAAPSCCSGLAGMTTPVAVDTAVTPDKLATCPVTGEKLGSDMGGPYVLTYQGQEVKLCCKSCKPKFDKNPDKFIALIRAADKN